MVLPPDMRAYTEKPSSDSSSGCLILDMLLLEGHKNQAADASHRLSHFRLNPGSNPAYFQALRKVYGFFPGDRALGLSRLKSLMTLSLEDLYGAGGQFRLLLTHSDTQVVALLIDENTSTTASGNLWDLEPARRSYHHRLSDPVVFDPFSGRACTVEGQNDDIIRVMEYVPFTPPLS